MRRQKVLSAIKRLSKQLLAKVRSLLEVAVKKWILMKDRSRYELASKLNNTFSRSKRNRERRRTKTSSSTMARRGRKSRRRSRSQTRRLHKIPISYFQNMIDLTFTRSRTTKLSDDEGVITDRATKVLAEPSFTTQYCSCSDSSYKTMLFKWELEQFKFCWLNLLQREAENNPSSLLFEL